MKTNTTAASICFALVAVHIVVARALGGQGDDATIARVAEIEKRILTARAEIHSGHFIVRDTYDDYESKRPTIHQVFDTWIDGNLIREIRFEDGLAKKFATYTSWSRDWMYCYDPSPLAVNPTTRIYLIAIRADSLNRKEDHYVHEPLLLMLHPLWYGAGYVFNRNSFVGNSKRDQFAVTSTDSGNLKTVSVRFRMTAEPEGTWAQYTYVPSRGDNISRIEYHWRDGGHEVIDANDATLKMTDGGTWFPAKIVYTRTTSNSTSPSMRSTLGIDASGINQTVDQNLFQPASFDVPKGTWVTRRTGPHSVEKENLQWDGARIVPLSASQLLEEVYGQQHQQQRTNRKRIALLASSAGIALLVAVILIVRARSKRPARSEGTLR